MLNNNMNGKTIGIISIKGGVGKTSSVSALGASLANDYHKKVLVVDANFSAPTLGMHLGLPRPEVTLHHVLNDQASVKDAIYETNHGFDILPGALIFEKINPFKLAEKIRDLRRKYDVILLDSSPNLNDEVLAVMMASDELLAVTTPDYITLASTLRAIKIAKDRKTPIIGLVLNKVYNKNFEIDLEDIEAFSGCSVLAVLPHEVNVLESLAKGVPSTLDKNSASGLEYKKLAASLIGESYDEGRIKSFIKKMTGRVPKQEVNRVIFTGTRKASF